MGVKFKTSLILVKDFEGNVLIDNGIEYFKGEVEHSATPREALLMLADALEQFRQEYIISEVKKR